MPKAYPKKLVSVIVPVYNVGRYIGRCLDSILKQSYSNIEVIVVYDNSPDDTLNILKKYENKIKLINVQRKTSPAIARNIGLAYAKGEYVSFCDGDDFLAPEKLTKQVNVLNEFSDVGLVYNDLILADEFGRELKRIQVPEWNKRRWLSRPFTLTTSSILLRRRVLDEVREKGRYFNEDLLACEDLDLWIRLSTVTVFKRVPFFLTYYTLHEDQLSKDIIKTVIMGAKVLMKHGFYVRAISQSAFELSKMVLNKVLQNPVIGFGFFSESEINNSNVKKC